MAPNKHIMHIGLDDTDSTRGGCTTYVAALLVERLEKLGAYILDYPSLVRLNPNVPWKTRGNGALSLTITYDPALEEQVKQETVALVESQADFSWKGTDPGIAFLKDETVPPEITAFTKKAITEIVTLKEAKTLLERFHGESKGYNKQRGIIGALAAIGETFQQDHTYELIAYRKPENLGTKRRVDEESIYQMDQALQPHTFNNVDTEKRRVIITPRGPDPILFGVRGETPTVVKQAFDMIRCLEPVERWMIFRSNQGTDAHIKPITTLSGAQPYSSIVTEGTVSKSPHNVPLRHTIFSIADSMTEIDCAAYEPTGTLRATARELSVGDKVQVYGAVRKATADKPLTVNLEKINILQLAAKQQAQNPSCPNCGKRLESMGKNQGFRCPKCKAKFPKLQKTLVDQARNLKPGLYITSTRSQRHLTKPLRRYGLEKHGQPHFPLIQQWHSKGSA